MATRVSNCGKDEYGGWHGGRAGDQTGGEYHVIDWYNFRQTIVLRHPNAKVRKLIAEMAVAAANNNHIGYDQYERLTFWNQLKKVGYNPANIRVDCEADCSSSTAAIVKAAGYRLGDQRLQNVSADLYTGNERAILQAAGFTVLTGSKYTSSGDYLLAGDINLNERTHTNIVVTNGSKAGSSDPIPSTNTGNVGGNIVADGIWGRETTTLAQKQAGTTVDGIVSSQPYWTKAHLKGCEAGSWEWVPDNEANGSQLIVAIQKRLRALGHYEGVIDGLFERLSWQALERWAGIYPDNELSNPSITIEIFQRKLNEGRFF